MILDFSQNDFKMIFEITDKNSVILKHFSKRDAKREKKPLHRSIANVHVSGKNQDAHHFFCHTGCSGDFSLRYVSHRYYEKADGNKLEFILADEQMQVTVHYQFYNNLAAVRAWSVVTNIGNEPLGLEYVSSFSYTGFDDGERSVNDSISIYIPHNSCIKELNWRKYSLHEIGMDGVGLKRISISNTGTWSTKEYLPMGAIEDSEQKQTYLWQIENNGSWQWEISGIDKMLYFKLSGPNETENHWYKELKTGESFESVKVCVALGEDFNAALAELTAYRRRIYKMNASNAKIPVIFNDYMNCLTGRPTEENERPIIELAAEVGAEYYCIDAGWYADGTWWETVGEWQPCGWRFPNGIQRVFDFIKEKGMVPGIWLEPEVMGINCPLAKEWPDECFFLRHGKRVIDNGRYQLDFRNQRVRAHVTAVVDRLVNEYGVGYIKMDYNIEGGVGTEHLSDSVGDGLLEHNRAFFAWLSEISAKYPELIIENCASGGMRMDYKQLSLLHMQSTSDQTDYTINAHIAAAASTGVLPEQGAVWAYPLADADQNAIQMNMVNAMLQRIHLSGKIFAWNREQLELVKEAVTCYKTYREEIPQSVPLYPLGLPHFEDKLFCSAYRTPTCIRIGVWRMDSKTDTLDIPLDTAYQNVCVRYPHSSSATVERVEGGVRVRLAKPFTAAIVEVY